jgi:hypothetical protein
MNHKPSTDPTEVPSILNRPLRGLTVIAVCLLAGCVHELGYDVLAPVSPKPNTARFSTPVNVDSLRPTFRWKPVEPNQRFDLAIWEAAGTQDPGFIQGDRVYYRQGIEGDHHLPEVALRPNRVYLWSVRPTGTESWATAFYYAEEAHLFGHSRARRSGRLFPIRTPAE